MKKMRKMMATLVALTLALSTMSISVLAAEKADIEGGGDYLGNEITISYGEENYKFTREDEGSKWKSENGFAELGLGKDGEASVVVTGQDGQKYDATLTNKSNGLGNDKDNGNGTDHYKFGSLAPQSTGGDNTTGDDTTGDDTTGDNIIGDNTIINTTPDDTINQPQEEPKQEEPQQETIKSEPVYIPVYDDDDDYDYDDDYDDEPEIEIVEEEVPLAEIPEVEEPVVEIAEEEVPLADVPKTGDPMTLWMALSGISAAGLALLSKKGKED